MLKMNETDIDRTWYANQSFWYISEISWNELESTSYNSDSTLYDSDSTSNDSDITLYYSVSTLCDSTLYKSESSSDDSDNTSDESERTYFSHFVSESFEQEVTRRGINDYDSGKLAVELIKLREDMQFNLLLAMF